VFFGDIAQQILLAQHPGSQAFCSGALERTHDRVARPTEAVKSAAAVAIEMMILLNIDFRIAQVRPRVEKCVAETKGSACVSRAGDRVFPITDFSSALCFFSCRELLRKIISARRRNQHARRMCYPCRSILR